MARVLIVLILLLALGGLAVWLVLPRAPSVAPGRGPARIGRFPASQFFLEHDLFLPATNPQTVAAARASHLRDDDEVFGVVVGKQPRAYPIYMISYHHVVNDVVRGIPIAVTY